MVELRCREGIVGLTRARVGGVWQRAAEGNRVGHPRKRQVGQADRGRGADRAAQAADQGEEGQEEEGGGGQEGIVRALTRGKG
eukprot:536124-Rhodomonas_salina.3